MGHLRYLLLPLLFFSVGCHREFPTNWLYVPPPQSNDGIEVGSLLEVGMDSGTLAELIGRIEADKYKQIHSMLMYKDGLLVFEEYFEGKTYQWDGPGYHGNRIQWHRDSLHVIMSVSKSMTSAMIGIAIDKGYIKSVHDPIFEYLPDHQSFRAGGKEAITVEHLLTMSSGLDWDEWGAPHGTSANDIDRLYFDCQEDPITCVLEKELTHKPAEKFTYNGGGMIMLGEILKNASDMDVGSFSRKFLWDPLGIDSVFWYQFANGVYGCDGSLRMTSRDMLKLGITYLDEGRWKEQRILSQAWVEKSRIPFGNNIGINLPIDDSGRNGYSYSWWTNSISGGGIKVDLFQAGGWGGQEIIVIPDLDMVVVFTGGNFSGKKKIHQILEKFVLPAIR